MSSSTCSTYQTISTLRTQLTTAKKSQRKSTFNQLHTLLSSSSTLPFLRYEASLSYNSKNDKLYPEERVRILLRNVLESVLLVCRGCISEEKKKTANGTGYVKQSIKFTLEEVLFPYKIFVCLDPSSTLECFGYKEDIVDWKSVMRYCFHLDIISSPSFKDSSDGLGYSATFYPEYIDGREHVTNFTSKEIIACISYILMCLNHDDCRSLAEVELMQWLCHICCRCDYVALLPLYGEVSYVLNEISGRIYAEGNTSMALNSGSGGGVKKGKTSILGHNNNNSSNSSSNNNQRVKQECLLSTAKCLNGLVYNLTTRLGTSMHLYLRPILECIAHYTHYAWLYQNGGIDDTLRTEFDILSILPHLYSTVTHLLACHPEQSVPILSECGHNFLRLAKKNYLKSFTTSNDALRDALTEYMGVHLLIAEVAGKLYGLPEGDLGPLLSIDEEEKEDKEDNGEKITKLGATLDKRGIDSLLDIVRDDKVWESLFASEKQDTKKTYQRNRFRTTTKKKKYAISSAEGGGSWTPLNKRQRRYLELIARLLRISQRLHLAEAEAVGDGTLDPIEELKNEAEQMMQKRLDIENGEIDIDVGGDSEEVNTQLALDEALAETPFVMFVCRHLYQLNPKLNRVAVSQVAKAASMTQSTLFTQSLSFGESLSGHDEDTSSHEQCLIKSCHLLRALVTKQSSTKYKADSNSASTKAILQLVCACAEAFPRGECWSSSARQNWSTTLDENTYAGGASARVRERHGSSPADAAAVVYLLGTTLECCGGSGGDENVQVWTLMALLKMTESSAIISTRDGVPISSLEALRVAWQFVWKTVFRYDLRYSSYTSGAYAGNAGELVLQLMTQMIRYQCTDRRVEGQSLGSVCAPFVQAKILDILKLPVFEKPASILSGTCFELVTALMQFAEIPTNTTLSTVFPDVSNTPPENRDRRWLISVCLQFIENSLVEDKAESVIQRSFHPFVATCLASLISDGNIVQNTSTFELDNLMKFSVTEDTDPVCIVNRPDLDPLACDASLNQIHDMLWRKTLVPHIQPGDCCLRLEQRIAQGRGAVLNQFSDSIQEREKLFAALRVTSNSSNVARKHHVLGTMAFDKIKSIFDEILFGLRYGSDDEDESEGEHAITKRKKDADTPRLNGCLSMLLTIVLSSRATITDVTRYISDIAPGTIVRVLDHLPEVFDSMVLKPTDLLSVLNHLDGICRVLTHCIAANGESSNGTPSMRDQFKAIFSACRGILRNHRHAMYTSSYVSPSYKLQQQVDRRQVNESDDDRFGSAQKPIQRRTQNLQFSDDSDGFMDDAEDAGPSRLGRRHPPKHSAPPTKRQRTGKALMQVKEDRKPVVAKTIDCQCAWSCASLMILLNPSIDCLEIITGHLVWPEDTDSENGYSPVTKSLDPNEAIVCSTLFIQKSVILREHEKDDQQSAIIFCVEVILEARRHLSPSSKYFMHGLGLLLKLIEIGDRSEGFPFTSRSESKCVVDMLYPEGISQDNEDYRRIRQLRKVLRFRNTHLAEQLHVAIGLFLGGQDSVHAALDSIFSDHFIKSSFRHIDETMRSRAADALGVALGGFQDQKMIVSEMNRSILPPLKSERKYARWLNSLADPKTPVDLSQLEQSALADARLSFEFHAIDCIGLIAGSTADEGVCIDMIWKLLDLASFEPAMGLLCRRACERAALILGFKSVGDLLSDIAPHLLVRWIESRRSLNDFPLLMTSSYTMRKCCRYLPNEVLEVLLCEGGWDDKFLNVDISNFVQSSGAFLVPIILLMDSDQAFDDEDVNINASTYLSEFITITAASTSDETFAKVLRYHISDIFSFVLVLSEHDDPKIKQIAGEVTNYLLGRISEAHIQSDGAKQAFMIMRQILKLNAVGISIVGQQVDMTQAHFMAGMKSVSKNINQPSTGGFLHSVGSSLTELFILSGYWLSSNGVSLRQRDKFWKPIQLLFIILTEQLQESTISSQELYFCIGFFVSTALDPDNHYLCPHILQALSSILKILFYNAKGSTYVEKNIPAIHQLCLALLAIHKKNFLEFVEKCQVSMLNISYQKICSIGIVSKCGGASDLLDADNDEPAPSNHSILKELITSKINSEEKTLSEIMIGAYDCLDTIVNSGKISLDDILGADDIVNQHEAAKRRVFGDVNEKYEIEHLFNTSRRERGLVEECKQFIQTIEQYPIISKIGHLSQSRVQDAHSVGALARLLALRRLEKLILAQHVLFDEEIAIPYTVVEHLVGICQSNDSNEAKMISSKCLGGLSSGKINVSSKYRNPQRQIMRDDPLQSMKMKALSLIGQFVLSGSPEVSLVAMKTAKSLLLLKDGKESWNSLEDGEPKEVLKPFVVSTSKQSKSNGILPKKEQVALSTNYINKLKMIAGEPSLINDSNWCWNDALWTSCLREDGINVRDDCWILNIVSALIACFFSNESSGLRCKFISVCHGLGAKQASFASCLFPGIIYSLLDNESFDDRFDKHSIRDKVLSETAVGSPTSEMNNSITRCFACILDACNTSEDSSVVPYAIEVVLNTLEILHNVTKNRFLSCSSHKKNVQDLPKGFSTTSKKRRSSDLKDLRTPNPPKWRGVPFGVVLRLDGLDIAKACLKSKQYYSAIYFCEMAMNNYCGVGNFLEQIATDSLIDATFVGDISGYGIEQTEQRETTLALALKATDILVFCLTELQLKDELQGVLSQASALSLKQSMTTLNLVHESHNDQSYSMLLDLDIELQSRSSAMDISREAVKVSTFLEDLGLDHVKQHYLQGISSSSKLQFNEKWFEDALLKTSQWDSLLLTQPSDNLMTSISTQGINPSSMTTTFADILPTPSLGLSPSYNEEIYQALQNFVREDISGGYSAVARAQETVLGEISLMKEVNITSMANYLTRLEICGSLTSVGEVMEGKTSLQDLLKHWDLQNEVAIKDLKYLLLSQLDETSLDIGQQSSMVDGDLFRTFRLGYSVKEVLVSLLLKSFPEDRVDISRALSAHIHRSSQMYRDLGRPDVAKQSLSRLRAVLPFFDDVPSIIPVALRLEDVKIMARQLDFDNAITHCKTIANYLSHNKSDDSDHCGLLVQTLLLGGCLMAHEHVDAVEVMESFFCRAAKLAHHSHVKDPNTSSLIPAVAYFKLGEFASNIYSSADARVSSETWRQRKATLVEREKEEDEMKNELAQLEQKYKKTKKQNDYIAFEALKRQRSSFFKEVELERREITNNQDSLHKYLGLALESYCNALKLCPTTATSIDYSKHVFKLVGLWFKNCERSETQSIANSLIQSNIDQIPSYHFVPLTYQIFSRIDVSSPDDSFQTTLTKLVTKICSEHPYHGLPQLIALSNGNLTNKVEAANEIIKQLQSQAPNYVAGLIDSYRCLMNSYIDLAELNTKEICKHQTKGFKFSSYKLKLDTCLSGGRRGSKNLSLGNAPAIITKPPSIRPDAQYGNGVDDPINTERVVGFESTFDVATSGLSRPAIVMCIGSNGGRYKQLVKGDDDMRQDAVMQQVFETMNNLLGNESISGNHAIYKLTSNPRQQLKVITYGILPLSPKAGVIEWVEDTDSFGNYMIGSSKRVGACDKYYPGEWGNRACSKLYGDGHENKSQEERRRDFDIICRNISPVFRFFFIENFSSSMEAWHTARTAYTRSCAVNSIVGHILGIGDRHTSNIMIHTKTGELVHIDFGYVFEQAKLLNTPETVPFRLTRNIIDGMGPCGTDGVFSKSAESTLSVLRKNSDTVLTILSAIVSDTLDKWSQSTSKNDNDAADRAMSKVRDKLQGYEDGTTGVHTVAGQIKFLINEARDPNNLCNLYVGWSSWI